jgi:hypothetical protein
MENRDERIVHFEEGINKLCRETGVKITSWDGDVAMISVGDLDLHFLKPVNEDTPEYKVVSRQEYIGEKE